MVSDVRRLKTDDAIQLHLSSPAVLCGLHADIDSITLFMSIYVLGDLECGNSAPQSTMLVNIKSLSFSTVDQILISPSLSSCSRIN